MPDAWRLIARDAHSGGVIPRGAHAAASPDDRDRRRHTLAAPPGKWLHENLFSSVFNSVLTVVSVLVLLWALRGLLNFIFSEERTWDAVRVNLRLLFTHSYPEERFSRVWTSVGAIAVMTGLSLGLSARFPAIPLRRIGIWFTTAGGFITLGVLLCRPAVLTTVDGKSLRDATGELVRQSFVQAIVDRGSWCLAAAVLVGVGLVVCYGPGARSRRIGVSAVPFSFVVLGALVASAWLYPWGHYGFAEGGYIYEPGRTVAATTKIPWTVMWVLLVVSWLAGGALRAVSSIGRLRSALNVSWLLAPFALYWAVLRAPAIDWSRVWPVEWTMWKTWTTWTTWSMDLPMVLAFAVGGTAVLWFLTRPSAGEPARVIAVWLLMFALFNWAAALFGWYPMLQKARISFLLLALAALLAPNFLGVTAQRLRLVLGWLGVISVFHCLATLVNTESTLDTPTENFIGGFGVTLVVAVFTLMFSFPLGVAMALARTSRMPIFRVISTWYIETVRGVPLITILFFFSIMVPLFLPSGMDLGEMAAIVIGYTLFSAAYLAENVRGGIQSVRKGQHEAADSLGLTAGQRTAFIVLPQALRVSIPPLVGQVIAIFKETSLIAIVGGFDFLRIANNVIPAQSEFLGADREALLFVSVVYWAFAFAISKYSQRLEKQLGLGRR